MNDELTSRLTRQLHEQVDDWQGAPLTLDDVRGRARSIRRTRRVVTGAAVAAVIAVAVPVTLVAAGGLDASPDRNLPPASNSPSEAVENPSGLGIPYVEGRTLTLPDGAETELPERYDGVAVLDDLVLATRIDGDTGNATLDRIEDGEVVGSEDLASFSLASNAEGSAVAYLRSDGVLVVEGSDGPTEVADVGRGQPVALVGGPDCTADDCVVFLNQGATAIAVSGSGEVSQLPGNPMAVHDASAATGRVSMQISVDDFEPSSCSRVVEDNGSGSTVFETCDFTPDRFSPDGSYLRAGPSYRSGIGDSVVAIIDGETGVELARFEPQDGFISTSAWEDAEHLLTVTHDSSAGEWSVIRLGVDGSTETVLGPVEGGDMDRPWLLVGAG